MRKILVSAAAVAAIATAAPAFAQAGPSSTDTAQASATIVAPISITNIQGLDFGSIAADVAQGTVTINTDGTRDSSSPNLRIGTGGQAATFDINGESGLAYNVSVDPSVTLTHASSAATMSASLNGSAATGLVDNSAAADLSVGGVLTVGANQAAGSYSGTFSVSVQYQ